jgi:hypothetical protein
MHVRALLAHLDRTNQYVAEGEYHLEQQRARIAQLRLHGTRTDVARATELLAQLKRLLSVHLDHREQLRALLQNGEHINHRGPGEWEQDR